MEDKNRKNQHHPEIQFILNRNLIFQLLFTSYSTLSIEFFCYEKIHETYPSKTSFSDRMVCICVDIGLPGKDPNLSTFVGFLIPPVILLLHGQFVFYYEG